MISGRRHHILISRSGRPSGGARRCFDGAGTGSQFFMTGRLLAELALKALCGGALVLLFALFAQTLSPKRFAGVFAAAPTVAAASLSVTVLFKGSSDAERA